MTIEDILISRDEIEKIHRGEISLTLWRGLHVDETKENPFYPDFDYEEKILPSGEIRDPDVNTEIVNGVRYVKAELGMGTSTVDKEGIFGFKNWEYFVIPAGTSIPTELIITKDFYMKRKACWHYSISPNEYMKVVDYKKALDQLAFNAGLVIKDKKNGWNWF